MIEVNPIVWQIILNLFILTFRPSKTAKAYKEIWMKNENMSPLLYYTKKQSERTSGLLQRKYLFRFCNEIRKPKKSKIHKLHEMGCENLVSSSLSSICSSNNGNSL